MSTSIYKMAFEFSHFVHSFRGYHRLIRESSNSSHTSTWFYIAFAINDCAYRERCLVGILDARRPRNLPFFSPSSLPRRTVELLAYITRTSIPRKLAHRRKMQDEAETHRGTKRNWTDFAAHKAATRPGTTVQIGMKKEGACSEGAWVYRQALSTTLFSLLGPAAVPSRYRRGCRAAYIAKLP